MRQEDGLNQLLSGFSGNLTTKILADLLLEDLKHCQCLIMGKTLAEETVVLAELAILPASLYYEKIDKRIDFTVCGVILNDQFPALTYRVQGLDFAFYGRCSTIARVCGVDLYLSHTYTGKRGDVARQNFSISVKKLLVQVKS